MAKKEFKKEDEQLEEVNEALSTTGQWIEKHATVISIVIAAIAAVVLGIIALNQYVFKPAAEEASNENAKAVVYFMQGDWKKALDGDEAECIGFRAIADDYKLYKPGKLASLYAGICLYEMGEYDEAAKYIKRFKADDLNIDPSAHVLLGDAYVQMDELEDAVKAYKKAAKNENEIIAPIALMKCGLVYLELGDKKAAKEAFESIKNDYPTSAEAQDAEKYIAIAAE